MSGRRRYNRPGGGSFFGMLFVNGVAAFILLKIVFALFGTGLILSQRLAAYGPTHAAARWDTFWAMLPGAALGYACLWYWLILVGRSRGISWGGASIYGVLIAFGNVLAAGFLIGLLHGNPLLGLLIGFVMLLMIPSLLLAMICFGLAMGGFNGLLAYNWIERHRPH